MQAVIPMVGNISNLSNLDLLVPVPYHPPMALLQRGTIFINHKLSTAKAADYLNDCCPPVCERQNHSDTSTLECHETIMI